MNDMPLSIEDSKKLANQPAVIKYLKKNCKNFNPHRVYISYKHGRKFEMVVAGKTNLIVNEFYDDTRALDCLIPRLENYFKTGQWDTDQYYQPYYTKGKVNEKFAFGNVIRVAGHLSIMNAIQKYRKANPNIDLGFREVPPTVTADYYTMT